MREHVPLVGPHLVRYGTAADQKYLLDGFLRTYDELVINATMVAHMPSALASFLVTRAKNKPYFIDPQTHAFQHDVTYLESNSEGRLGEIRRSIQKLIDAYGEPIATAICQRRDDRRPVQPADFADERTIEGFCDRVVRFQQDAISHEATESDAARYYEFLRASGKFAHVQFGPSLVVAPYFYMTAEALSDWLRINVLLAQRCLAGVAKRPVGVQVVVSRSILTNRRARATIVAEYAKLRPAPAAFLLWIDDFPETGASEAQLRGFAGLVRELGAHAPVINLYGGFFSVALSRCGIRPELAGVVHGLEYGESRGVIPVGGGIPVAKYYYPALHTRLPFRHAVRAVRAAGGMGTAADFHEKVCGCRECTRVITSDPSAEFMDYGRTKPVRFIRRGVPTAMEYPLPETKDHSVRHFMWSKGREYRATMSIGGVLEQLSEALVLAAVVGSEAAHCAVWAEVLRRMAGQ